MNKKDLKQGSIIETEYGAQYILVDKTFINLETGCYLDSTEYDNDLFSPVGAPIISKIFIPVRTHEGYINYIDKNLKWTWERKNDIQFNIGDIVKGKFYDRTKGRIGKVVERVNNLYLVEYDEYFEGDNGGYLNKKYAQKTNNYWWEKNTTLELVRAFTQHEVEQTPQHEFKVGDKVKILDNVEDFNNEHRKSFIGKIGTIINKKGLFKPYLVYLGKDFDGHNGSSELNDNNWWFSENNLELVKEPTPEFKVGDVINTPLGIGKVVEVGVIGKFYLVYLGTHFKGHDFWGSQPNNNNWIFKKEELSHSAIKL